MEEKKNVPKKPRAASSANPAPNRLPYPAAPWPYPGKSLFACARPASNATHPKVKGSVVFFTNSRHFPCAVRGEADLISATVKVGKTQKRRGCSSSGF